MPLDHVGVMFRQLADPESEVRRSAVLSLLSVPLATKDKKLLGQWLLDLPRRSIGMERGERIRAAAQLEESQYDADLLRIARDRTDPDHWIAVECLSRRKCLGDLRLLLEELGSLERGTLAAELLAVQPLTRRDINVPRLRREFDGALDGGLTEKALWLALLLGRFEEFETLEELSRALAEGSTRAIRCDAMPLFGRLQAFAPVPEPLLFYLQVRSLEVIQSTPRQLLTSGPLASLFGSLYSTLISPAKNESALTDLIHSLRVPLLGPLAVYQRPNPQLARRAREALARFPKRLEPTERSSENADDIGAIIDFAIIEHLPVLERPAALVAAYERGPLASLFVEDYADLREHPAFQVAVSPVGRLLDVFPEATPSPQQVFRAYAALAKQHPDFAASAGAFLLARVEPSRLVAALAPWLHHGERTKRIAAWRILAASLALRKDGWARRRPLSFALGGGAGGLTPPPLPPMAPFVELHREVLQAPTSTVDKPSSAPHVTDAGDAVRVVLLGRPVETVSEPETYVNFAFFNTDEGGRQLEVSEGLVIRTSYLLEVSLGFEPDERFSDAAGVEPPIIFPSDQDQSIDIDVVAISAAKALIVENPLSVLRWMRGRPSEQPAVIRLRCEEPANYPAYLRLDLYISYRGNLLFIANLELELEADPKWRDPMPIRWRNVEKGQSGRLYRIPAYIDQMREKRLSVVLERDCDDLLITAFSRDVAYPARIQRTRQELAHLVDYARFVLDMLRVSPIYASGGYDASNEYTGAYAAGSDVLDETGETVLGGLQVGKALQQLSRRVWQIGNQIWKRLFLSGVDDTFSSRISQLLTDGATILFWISRGAEECTLPWALLCEDEYDPNANASLDFKRLWGYRFAIEQRLGASPTLDPIVETAEKLRMLAAMHEFEPWTESQRHFFQRWNGKLAGRFYLTRFEGGEEWRRELFGPRDILYFYAHGRAAHLLSAEYLTLAARFAKFDDQVEVAPDGLDFSKREGAVEEAVLEPEIVIGDLRIPFSALRKTERNDALAPVVILNMCESAPRTAYESDSWINRLFDLGVRTVVGTEVPIIPAFGNAVARRLFDGLLSQVGKPSMPSLCEALHAVRREFLERKNLLILAYVSYGEARFVNGHQHEDGERHD